MFSDEMEVDPQMRMPDWTVTREIGEKIVEKWKMKAERLEEQEKHLTEAIKGLCNIVRVVAYLTKNDSDCFII